ncbi:MAG: hypothetical protein U0599_26450 [Vicinamibacteria bacterium]
MPSSRPRAATGALLFVLAATAAHAQSAGERYSLRGFGGWALGRTDNENVYGYVASGDTEYANYNFALNLAAKPTDKLSIRSQAFWGEDLRGRRVDLDYVFVEWAQSPKLKFRAGKVLSPFGLYTETYDVGTLRPFYLLPQFYAGTQGLLPKSYLGGGLTGSFELGENWELDYDAFGGEVHFNRVKSTVILGQDPSTGLPVSQTFDLDLIGRGMFGGRLGISSPAKGLQLGVSALHADIYQSVNGGPRETYPVTEEATLANAYARYDRGPFRVQAEYFYAFADSVALWSGYVEASYRIGRHWQLAGTYDRGQLNPDAGSLYATLPDQLKRHESVGLALNFWASPDVAFKLNGYSVHGNQAARSDDILDTVLGRLDDSTYVLVLGTQFSF